MRNMTARSDAKRLGLKTYETGIPCKKGHLAPRATATGTCVQCTREASAAWNSKNPSKSREYTATYRDRNKELIREKDRLAKEEKRKENPDEFRGKKREAYKKKIESLGGEVRPFNLMPVSELVIRLQNKFEGQLLYVGGYTNMNAKAAFLCVKHENLVEAHPNNVLKGANPCPKCNHMKSAGEDQVARFLSIFTTVQRRDRSIIGPKELDIVMPDKSLALEYCGMFWHSHGDKTSEDKDKNNHYNKFKACADNGIRLITMYESEWQNNQYAVKRLLRNAIGKSKGKLMARKCELKKATTQEARAFYEKYHPQGGAGHGEHYALYWNGKIVACMRFVLGANDRGAAGKNRVWTLGRYATRITVSGGASRLFKAFLKEFNPECVKSFSDNRYFAGGMYEQLGFDMEENVVPDYQVWSPKIGIRPKSHYQRRALPSRIEEHGFCTSFDPETDKRTEREVTFEIGARRIYDCGKKRWIWNKLVDTP